MSKFKCKKCGAIFSSDYWNETLECQVMGNDEFMPIEEEHEGLIWKCPGCMKNVSVEEV